MSSTIKYALFGVILLGFSTCDARAAVEFEDYCKTEYPPALRQTILVLDEQLITPENKTSAKPNDGWRTFIGELLDTHRPAISRDFLPRERVSIFVARQDGSGTWRVFSGCLPFYSEDEKSAADEGRGKMKYVDTFFGYGFAAKEKRDGERFRGALARALTEIVQTGSNSPGSERDLLKSGFISSLRRSRITDVSKGVPRVILFSDFTRFDFAAAQKDEAARQVGFSMGGKAQLDFDCAEIYVASSGNAGSADLAEEVMRSFFLQSRGRLMSFAGTPAIPNFSGNPVRVLTFQGKIVYPVGTYPMRMRLAVDVNGDAVNSWVSVQSDVERYTPFGGILTCSSSKICKFIGDKVFGQIWKRGLKPEPEFDSSLPFSGLRELEFEINGERLTGKIFDSAGTIKDASKNMLEFELSRQASGAY